MFVYYDLRPHLILWQFFILLSLPLPETIPYSTQREYPSQHEHLVTLSEGILLTFSWGTCFCSTFAEMQFTCCDITIHSKIHLASLRLISSVRRNQSLFAPDTLRLIENCDKMTNFFLHCKKKWKELFPHSLLMSLCASSHSIIYLPERLTISFKSAMPGCSDSNFIWSYCPCDFARLLLGALCLLRHLPCS